MRKCPNCDALIVESSCTCPECLTTDYGWAEHCQSLKHNFHRKTVFMEQVMANQKLSDQQYKIRLSAFSDSGELGYHLSRLKQILSATSTGKIDVILNASSWAYDWDYAYDEEPERNVYLPPSLPLHALVEVARFVSALLDINNHQLTVEIILPPQKHAATQFVIKTGIFNLSGNIKISYEQHPTDLTYPQGCDDVLIPLTFVGQANNGQLTIDFHTNFDKLADAGYFKQEHRDAIRKVVMEAAENADNWGGGGWICCFLRQEKLGHGEGNFGDLEDDFIPAEHTHFFLHVYSIGPGLAQAMNQENDWNATDLVANGNSARQNGGGRGFPAILNTVIDSAWGTVSISSGNYTRIITPDGLSREYHSAGTDYLPGVHLCAIIPLKIISDIQETLATRQ